MLLGGLFPTGLNPTSKAHFKVILSQVQYIYISCHINYRLLSQWCIVVLCIFPVTSMFGNFSENIYSIMHQQAISVWNSKWQIFRDYLNSFRLEICGFVIYSIVEDLFRFVLPIQLNLQPKELVSDEQMVDCGTRS